MKKYINHEIPKSETKGSTYTNNKITPRTHVKTKSQ